MNKNTIFDFFKDFNNSDLGIEINNDIISFTKNKKKYDVSLILNNDSLIFDYCDNNLDNNHFTDILNQQNFNNINQIVEIIEFINKLNSHNYCIICKNKLDFQSEDYIPCDNQECLYKFEEIIVGNRVIEKIKNDPDISIFLIESAIDAINCQRKLDIFEPFPTHFLTNKNLDLERGNVSKLTNKNFDHFKDFSKINKTLINFDIDKLINVSNNCKTDKELSDKINKDLYLLIRFILMSCKVDIQKNDDMLGLKSDIFKIYKIIHPFDKEEEFNKNNCINKSYLFHGSKWCNWYSILRNGLKNCSQTKLMTAGAAHGNGIYLSSDVNLSYGYGASGHKSIIGVFEVCNKDQYFKGGTIFVVDNEKVLIQRYLLILPANKYNNNFIQDINKIFNTNIHKEKLNINIKYNKKSIAKIIREYKQLISLDPSQSKFRISVDPDFPFLWKIFINKFDDKYALSQDMIKYNIEEIELEVRFPDNYPFSPPFIRVVSPRFMHLTGHITTGGSICQEILTDKHWLPTCSIESLIIIIISEIIEGEGRLDPNKYHIPYSLNEAKESFVRVANSHGWM